MTDTFDPHRATVDDLHDYAREHDIDLGGATRKADLIEAITAAEPASGHRQLVGNVQVDGVWYGPAYGNAGQVPSGVAERITNPAAWA